MKSNKNEPLISVIICNYNYEKFVDKSIKSVFEQTYSNLELIIIDDGSTDNSRKMIEKTLEERSENIKNIIYEYHANQGIVSTRNEALKLVNGEWYVFVDADDAIPNNFIIELHKEAKRSGADVICCDLTRSGIHDDIRYIEPLNKETVTIFLATPICQLVKSKWIKTHKFEQKMETVGNEDSDFFLGLLLDGAKFSKTEKTTYYYNVHGEGRNPLERDESYYIPRLLLLLKYGEKLPYLVDFLAENIYKKDLRIIRQKEHIANQKEQINVLQQHIEELQKRIIDIKDSKSYKVGKLVVYPIKKIKNMIK